ncbi:alpha-L-arabinofuranosidase [Breznakibacter xylanolyticus]|uniref:non-reducing end alpha-L-arabinofuranosidase n=1 Tax=Breznakibacter xylanolyticus TaxID=990 RepID=A0A2W7NGE1_9BACT|nr:alpha-L-arabinofuranosidase C-terminal domain-containing protein [Breznakibacter xylanolyticus]PZX10342.1 alpha-L-arabinofuranosidase [Breznakibacter xylanolyticus]
MKNKLLVFAFTFVTLFTSIKETVAMVNPPDSAYLFAYSTTNNLGKNGLHFAWSVDQKSWTSIGPEHRFLFCDYGSWGRGKRMLTPFLFLDQNQSWHCIWSLNETEGVFAHAASSDLSYWKPQTYPTVIMGDNCLFPEVSYNKTTQIYLITWLSTATKDTLVYGVTTSDFKAYSEAKRLKANNRLNVRKNITIGGVSETGIVCKVSWYQIESLIDAERLSSYKLQLEEESYNDDDIRFKGIKPIDATLSFDVSQSKKISDLLIGIFFEDLNYAADGGLYAELIQNRDFEYSLHDLKGSDKSWTSTKAWSLRGVGGTFTIDTVLPIHANNKNFAVLKISTIGPSLVNEGWSGISVTEGEKYNFSVFARTPENITKKLIVRLISKDGAVLGETSVTVNSLKWEKIDTVIAANQTIADASLEILPQSIGTVNLDMVSLFPQKTFNGRKNGLRADLAQTIADIHPRFMRFPGGCLVHGDGLNNIYHWKNTIGPLESRKPQRNLWGYHQTVGLGYFEYFQFCEDIGAEPLPVVAAGVCCQNSSDGGAGQQGGMPMCQMDSYIQDILDLIEYCNGDTKTTWGKKRAEAGHPKPFSLKYIGIGNEDLISDIFQERFEMIYKVVKEKHPEITVIGTVGPFEEGTDYTEGWNLATRLGVPMVDEHYYKLPGWFINNQDYYDKYDRTKSKVYLGEYASRGNALYNALAEASYLTAIERNGDVVHMTSYAPLLAKDGFVKWKTDLIYFGNNYIKPSVNYYVQKLYGENSGDAYIENNLALSDSKETVRRRVSASVVRDSKSGDLIIKLVNLLPVEVNTHVKLNGMDKMDTTAVQTTLTGNPGDKKVFPVTETCTVGSEFKISMPAYSFKVIRIVAKH